MNDGDGSRSAEKDRAREADRKAVAAEAYLLKPNDMEGALRIYQMAVDLGVVYPGLSRSLLRGQSNQDELRRRMVEIEVKSGYKRSDL